MVLRCLACGLLAALLSPADPLMDGYQDMYNLKFQAAHQAFQQYGATHPTNAMAPVSDAAAYLFFEFERLHILRSEFFANDGGIFSAKRLAPDQKVKRDFEAALAQGKRLADMALRTQPTDRDALLANVIGVALHADYLALIDKERLQALTEVKQARTHADALIKLHPDCYDAYLAAGVENYLLSQKIAPLRLLLRWGGAQTDKQEGVAKLRIVAEQGVYLKPYAKILLAIAALRDGKRDETIGLLRQLAVQFPGNALFQEELKKLSQ